MNARAESTFPTNHTATTPARWTRGDALALFERPLMDLVFEAQSIHRKYHNPNKVQLAQLLSIKTGGCSEDCSYCSQSARYKTDVERTPMMTLDEVVEKAKAAKAAGASRLCMGAAWRSPKDKDLDTICDMIQAVRNEGLETCVTLGMLTEQQTQRLKQAGLDYYNHNLDTDPNYYGQIISTRTYDDRLQTLGHVRNSGINVCSGGIIGMGESRTQRVGLLVQLANLPTPPQSVPINTLVATAGTPLENQSPVEPFELVRTIASARIMMPTAVVRLSAGRASMNDELQALCFLAGAGSIFYGEQLLTAPNPKSNADIALLNKLGMAPA